MITSYTCMTQNDINTKYLEFLNKAYSAENVAVERITSRIEEPYSKITAKIKTTSLVNHKSTKKIESNNI